MGAPLKLQSGSEHAPRKSPFLGVLFSVLLPGMGELYAGRFERGHAPLIVESALWLGLLGVNAYGNWIQQDARTQAISGAGIAPDGKDDQFYVDIGNYNSLSEYNAVKLVERSLDRLYPEDPSAGYSWAWRSPQEREAYKQRRIQADEMFNSSGFIVLGMIANRIWSGIQAALAVRDANGAPVSTITPRLKQDLSSGGYSLDGLSLNFMKTF